MFGYTTIVDVVVPTSLEFFDGVATRHKVTIAKLTELIYMGYVCIGYACEDSPCRVIVGGIDEGKSIVWRYVFEADFAVFFGA